MPAEAWVAQTEGTVALAAAGTAKTILSVIAGTGKMVALTEVCCSFDGTTASEKPILVELCRSTQAGAGTSTSVTLRSVRGNPNGTSGSTAAKNFSVEPTTVTPVREWLVDPNKGMLLVQEPLGREPVSLDGDALLLRMTIPSAGAAVNTRAYMEIEE